MFGPATASSGSNQRNRCRQIFNSSVQLTKSRKPLWKTCRRKILIFSTGLRKPKQTTKTLFTFPLVRLSDGRNGLSIQSIRDSRILDAKSFGDFQTNIMSCLMRTQRLIQSFGSEDGNHRLKYSITRQSRQE